MSAQDSKAGLALGIAAYGAWGVIPIYWKRLGMVGPYEILAHRVSGSVVVGVLLLLLTGRVGSTLAVLRDRAARRALLLSTALIGVNWGLFIWSVANARLTEASLGYFMNPPCNALLGRLALGERVTRVQGAAFALAGTGVLWLVGTGHGVPWLALALAVSFSFYGLVRKQAPVGALEGFTIETTLAAPLGLAYLVSRTPTFGAIRMVDPATRAMLLGAGAVTAAPLLAFAAAAKRLRYTTLGMVQFLSPSMQLFCAVALFGEPFPARMVVPFALIALGALLYAGDGLREASAAFHGSH